MVQITASRCCVTFVFKNIIQHVFTRQVQALPTSRFQQVQHVYKKSQNFTCLITSVSKSIPLPHQVQVSCTSLSSPVPCSSNPEYDQALRQLCGLHKTINKITSAAQHNRHNCTIDCTHRLKNSCNISL